MVTFKRFFAVLFIVLISAPVFSQNENKEITVGDIWSAYAFYPRTISGLNSMNDGKHYTTLERGKEIVQYSYQTAKKVKIIFNLQDIKKEERPENIDNYSFSTDETKLIIATEKEDIYRRSSKAFYYIYDLKAKTFIAVNKDKKQQIADLSPNGNKVAYMVDNNLFIKDLATDKSIQFTTDGNFNHIINGAPDWVYEEEFGLSKLFEWSQDGSKIAYVKFNESKVKEFTMAFYGNLYPQQYTYKYPKAGEDNSIVSVHVYDLNTNKTAKVNIGEETDIYIPRIKWTNDSNTLCVTRLNRLQNKLDLLFANATTGETNIVLTEENKYFIDIYDDLTFLKDNKHFIWTSEKDKWKHIYLYDMEGKLVKQITKGEWVVTEFLGVNEKTKTLYYISTEQSPLERDLYSVKLDGTKKTKLSKKKGVNQVDFSKNFKYYINTWSDANTPFYISIHKADGKEIKKLEDNSELKKKMVEYNFSKKEFGSFKNSDGVELNYSIHKPKDFDPNKKYPLYMYLYGGPGKQEVMNEWGWFAFVWHQLLTQKDYIVVIVDNRGTDNRGEDFSKATYMNMAKLESQDQIEAAKYFGAMDYIDETRIGIQGWSYGGTMSSLCLMVGADVFKMAISIAPVTNWRYYDNIYSERYMRTPQENAKGFDSYSPINHVDKLKGKLLLVHGTADDNVHYQNTVDLVNALQQANKQFDLMIYPNSNHGIYTGKNTRRHLYDMMTNYVLENL